MCPPIWPPMPKLSWTHTPTWLCLGKIVLFLNILAKPVKFLPSLPPLQQLHYQLLML